MCNCCLTLNCGIVVAAAPLETCPASASERASPSWLQPVKRNLTVAGRSEGQEFFAYRFDRKIPCPGCPCCKIRRGAKLEARSRWTHRPPGDLSPRVYDPKRSARTPSLHSFKFVFKKLEGPKDQRAPGPNDHSIGIGTSQVLGPDFAPPLGLLGPGSLKKEPTACSRPSTSKVEEDAPGGLSGTRSVQ